MYPVPMGPAVKQVCKKRNIELNDKKSKTTVLGMVKPECGLLTVWWDVSGP